MTSPCAKDGAFPGTGSPLESLCAAIRMDGQGLSVAINILIAEAINSVMDDKLLSQVWVSVNMAVPQLICQAFDGDEEARNHLIFIHKEFDPTILVPWAHIPGIELEKIDMQEATYGVSSLKFQDRLMRLLDAAMARAYDM